MDNEQHLQRAKESFFSWDHEEGAKFHERPAEAKAEANARLQFYREIAADEGWPDETEGVCWGQVLQQAVFHEDLHYDYPGDYRLENVEPTCGAIIGRASAGPIERKIAEVKRLREQLDTAREYLMDLAGAWAWKQSGDGRAAKEYEMLRAFIDATKQGTPTE